MLQALAGERSGLTRPKSNRQVAASEQSESSGAAAWLSGRRPRATFRMSPAGPCHSVNLWRMPYSYWL